MHRDTRALREKHIGNIRSLRTESGLFLASAKGVPTGYDKAWLRDNFYTALAFEAVEDWETVARVYRSILDILLKHEYKIDWAAQQKPFESYQYIHARYNPESFEEYWEEWGNKQNDAVGAILFKLADLAEKGRGVATSEDDKRIIQRLVDYLQSVEYWHDPDSGMWEEGEEVHASSIGACIAGLRKIKTAELANVPDEIIKNGEDALYTLLPRESKQKFADLAELSLMYPYDLLDAAHQDEILRNIEYHLVKRRGVVRYKGDRYYNKNDDGYSEEAEWTFGFPWLAVIYSRRGDKEKAEYYLQKAEESVSEGGLIPELYYSNTDTPNENVPLGWSESMFVVALAEYEKRFGS